VDERTGRLKLIEHVPTQGKTPRNFAIDPTGTLLLVANQGSDSIVTFRIDGKTGKLQPTGNKIDVPAPVCLKLVPALS
jgi:6-phosphogluconolactonase